MLEIKNKRLQCIGEVDEDWDKYEGYLFINLKPSNDFIKIARECGYISYDEYLKIKV